MQLIGGETCSKVGDDVILLLSGEAELLGLGAGVEAGGEGGALVSGGMDRDLG